MNKNNFMKAMSMIDEDLIQDANTQYTGEKSSDSANALYSENESEIVVSGVEVYHRTVWKKILAVAATFVLVTGAVGGGVYYFSKMNDKPVVNEEDNSTSIYEKIKTNKDSYDMSEYVWNFSAGADILVGEANDYKDELFEYLDSIAEVKRVDSVPASFRKVKFRFVNSNDKNEYFLSIHEDGYGEWSMNDENPLINEEFYSFGTVAFYDLFYKVMGEADSGTAENMNKVSQDELGDFLEHHLIGNEDDQVVFAPWKGALDVEIDNYMITDKNQLMNDLMGLEWVKIEESEFDYTNYYDMGIRVSEKGYLMAAEDDHYPFGCYKLKNEIECEKLVSAVRSVLGYDTEYRDASSEEIKEVFSGIIENDRISTWEGTGGIPQGGQYYGTIYRYYNMSDPESFINEIASLEWVTCSDKECEDAPGKSWSLSYTSLKESGYIGGQTKNNRYRYFKLKNDRDKDKIRPIADKYITMTDSSQLAEKIRIGIDNYSNLESDYVLENSDEYSGDHTSLRGHLYYDAENHKMYMNGEGIFEGKDVALETVMNGEDVSAYRIIDKATGETYREYTYCIVTPMRPRSPVHYI